MHFLCSTVHFLCSNVHFLCITQRVHVNSIQISQLIFCSCMRMHLKHCAHLTCVHVRTYLRTCAQNVRNQQWDHCWCHNGHRCLPRSTMNRGGTLFMHRPISANFLCRNSRSLYQYHQYTLHITRYIQGDLNCFVCSWKQPSDTNCWDIHDWGVCFNLYT